MDTESSPAKRHECFKRVGLLAWLSSEQVASLAGAARLHFYDQNEVVFENGSTGDGLHIIAEGEVIFISGPPEDPDRQSVSTLVAGEYFGELSLIDKRTRSAMARAALPTAIYFLSLEQLEKFSGEHPAQHAILITNLAREMARKIRRLNLKKSGQCTHCAKA